MDNKHKYFCDICPKKKNSDIFCSFDKCRDYENHIESDKHKFNLRILDANPKSITCKVCKKKFTEKGYEVHKKRNERLWTMLPLFTSKNSLTCNNFQWDSNEKRFNNIDALIEYRSNPVLSSALDTKNKLRRTKLSVLQHANNKFSYLKKYDDKTIDEKMDMIQDEDDEYNDKYSLRPQLDQCDLCYKYENEEKIYTLKHLQKWDMKECDCVDED